MANEADEAASLQQATAIKKRPMENVRKKL